MLTQFLAAAFALAVSAVSAVAQGAMCDNPAQFCGKNINTDCLGRVGAGSMRSGQTDTSAATGDCTQQLDNYFECVAAVAENCPVELPPPPRDTQRQRDVRAAQTELKRLGLYSGPIDGDWGPGSRRAMEDFQRNAGLSPITGELTPSDLSALKQTQTPQRAAPEQPQQNAPESQPVKPPECCFTFDNKRFCEPC